MGRKSKLTGEQWAQVEGRLMEGESRRALAREFKISEASIRARFPNAQQDQVKIVANQIVATERALQALPIPAQISAHNLAAKLRAISDNIASAAHYGAATAHRLTALANSEVAKVDDADPLGGDSMEAMRGVSALTKLANDSAAIALNLLAANKDTLKEAEAQARQRSIPESLDAFYGKRPG